MRFVLTGASGQLGGYVAERLAVLGGSGACWSGRTSGSRGGFVLRPVPLEDADAVEHALDEVDPGVVVHLAAISAVDEARRDPNRARRINVEATGHLAAWCARRGRKLVTASTDMVFDGRAGRPYVESDPTCPGTTYGRTKAEAEPLALAAPGAVVARLSLLYGPAPAGSAPTYLDRVVAALGRGEPQAFFEDEFRTPLDLATAAEILVALAGSDHAGIVHVGGGERLSRYALAVRVATALGLDPSLVGRNRQSDTTFAEPRPADVALDTTLLASWLPNLRRPTVEDATARLWGRAAKI